MNIKQFLKPDWRKIAVLFVLIILIIITFFHMTIVSLPNATGVPFSAWDALATVLIVPSFIIYNFYLPDAGLVVILITIVYWYLLSCLIVWIYDKMKRKK